MFVHEKCVLFFEKVRLFSQNDVLFLFYFLINPAGTTGYPPRSRPPQADPSRSRSPQWDTGKKRAVHTLLECILVKNVNADIVTKSKWAQRVSYFCRSIVRDESSVYFNVTAKHV